MYVMPTDPSRVPTDQSSTSNLLYQINTGYTITKAPLLPNLNTANGLFMTSTPIKTENDGPIFTVPSHYPAIFGQVPMQLGTLIINQVPVLGTLIFNQAPQPCLNNTDVSNTFSGTVGNFGEINQNFIKTEVIDSTDLGETNTSTGLYTAETPSLWGNSLSDLEMIKQEEIVINDVPLDPAKCIVTCNHRYQSLTHTDGSYSYIPEGLTSYENCLIVCCSNNTTYNCCNCLFSTNCIKEAVLHFVNNGSESHNTSIFWYNTTTLEFECGTCKFITINATRAIQHWEKHVFSSVLKCFLCSFDTRDDGVLKAHLMCHLNESGLIGKEIANNRKCGRTNVEYVTYKGITKIFWCLVCGARLKYIEYLRDHYLRRHGRKRFACSDCKEQFYYIAELKIHTGRVHTRDMLFRCLHCASVLKHKNSFIRHVNIHMTQMKCYTPEVKSKCLQLLAANECFKEVVEAAESISTNINVPNELEEKSVASDETLRKQLHNVHNETVNSNNPYKCPYCSFSGALLKYLKEHLTTKHTNVRKCCSLCTASFVHDRNLIRHIRFTHAKRMLQCLNCTFKTNYKSNLIRHMEYHTGDFSQLCYICGFQSTHERNMSLHIHRHSGIKNIVCSICSYQCFNQSILSLHMRTHFSERPYSCDRCDFSCKTKVYLNIHKQTHFQNRPYGCHSCNSTFKTKCVLKKHVAIHNLARARFYCATCGKEYLSNRFLLQHELDHSNFKPYRCPLCSARFMNMPNFEDHMTNHTDAGKMICFECGYSSFHRSNFAEHVNNTCQKAKHTTENQMHCFQCGYFSSHRSNFLNHVKCCHILKRKR